MLAKYKEQWLIALRSGKYEQGRELLRGDGCFCCLGVLCDVVKDDLPADHGWLDVTAASKGTQDLIPVALRHKDIKLFGPTDNREHGVLPDAVTRLVGISKSVEMDLICMNDKGKSFEEIADWIENEVPVTASLNTYIRSSC